MSSVEVFRVCLVRGLRVKCSEVNVPAHVTDYNTPPCFEKDSAMGQKGALWAWTKISKDMLKIYGKRDKYVSRTIYIYTGPNKDIYRTKQGYIQDIFIQDIFWTKTGLYTGQNIGHHILDKHILGQRQGQDTKQFWS